MKVKELDIEAAKRVLERVADEEAARPQRGGLIPPPEFVLDRRIAELERRVTELEKRLPPENGDCL